MIQYLYEDMLLFIVHCIRNLGTSSFLLTDTRGVDMAKDVVSGSTDDNLLPHFVNGPPRCKGRRWRIVQILVLATLLLLLWSWFTPSLWFRQSTVLPFDDDVPDIGLPKELLRKWAQYSPYIPVTKYIPPPPRCTITQVSTH